VSTIVSIATAVPAFSATQDEVKAAFGPLFALDGRRLDAAMALFDRAEVHTRHSVMPVTEIARPRSLTETMQVYARHARELGHRVAADCLRRAGVPASSVDLVITVSCTGIMIPSLDAGLIDTLDMRRDVRRLPITELGCVGGAAAVARADDHLRGTPEGYVLVICVELPSLSLQPADLSADNLVSSAIFGDGAAAVLLAGDASAARGPDAGGPQRGPRIRILETLSHTIPASTHALGFDLHDDGFHPVLSKHVPALLRAEIAGLTDRLGARTGVARDAIGAHVLHPGGKKVLGALEDALGLRREHTQPSWDVLREYGNQSSASVLFVLDRWQADRPPPRSTTGLMAAFGPGLTAQLLMLRWE
jgi:alkylresorcinol/alkylpyrone synthase